MFAIKSNILRGYCGYMGVELYFLDSSRKQKIDNFWIEKIYKTSFMSITWKRFIL